MKSDRIGINSEYFLPSSDPRLDEELLDDLSVAAGGYRSIFSEAEFVGVIAMTLAVIAVALSIGTAAGPDLSPSAVFAGLSSSGPAQMEQSTTLPVSAPLASAVTDDPATTATLSPVEQKAPTPLNIIPDRRQNLAPHEVMALQQLLTGHRFDPGKVDGRLGEKTLLAVAEYRKRHGLSEDATLRDVLNRLVQ